MGFFEALGKALIQGAANTIQKGMEIQARQQNMSDRDLAYTVMDDKNSITERRMALENLKRRRGQ